jgi:hypothetical protein
MTLSILRRLATQALIAAVAVVAVLTSGAPAQSLGDIAKQEESRRKSAGAGKVYTNENLKGAPEPAATAPAATPTAPADAAKTDAATPADAKTADGKTADAKTDEKAQAAAGGKGDEAAWRKRRQDLETALERSKTFAEALQSRINGLTADFAARDDPAQRNIVANDRQKALTELDRVKKEIQQHTKALADLQEEARKAGVPPGWLR